MQKPNMKKYQITIVVLILLSTIIYFGNSYFNLQLNENEKSLITSHIKLGDEYFETLNLKVTEYKSGDVFEYKKFKFKIKFKKDCNLKIGENINEELNPVETGFIFAFNTKTFHKNDVVGIEGYLFSSLEKSDFTIDKKCFFFKNEGSTFENDKDFRVMVQHYVRNGIECRQTSLGGKYANLVKLNENNKLNKADRNGFIFILYSIKNEIIRRDLHENKIGIQEFVNRQKNNSINAYLGIEN
jgi:hypothetical protein